MENEQVNVTPFGTNDFALDLQRADNLGLLEGYEDLDEDPHGISLAASIGMALVVFVLFVRPGP